MGEPGVLQEVTCSIIQETQYSVVMCVCVCRVHNSRGIFPPLETLAVKAVVAEGGEDAIN